MQYLRKLTENKVTVLPVMLIFVPFVDIIKAFMAHGLLKVVKVAEESGPEPQVLIVF